MKVCFSCQGLLGVLDRKADRVEECLWCLGLSWVPDPGDVSTGHGDDEVPGITPEWEFQGIAWQLWERLLLEEK